MTLLNAILSFPSILIIPVTSLSLLTGDPHDTNFVNYRLRRSHIAYFEVSIFPPTQEERTDRCESLWHLLTNSFRTPCVAVGLVDRHFPLTRYQPGWRRGSYAWHSDDGKKFGGYTTSFPVNYGPKFGAGDTIGCGWDQLKREIFFTHNGKPLRKNLKCFSSSRGCIYLRVGRTSYPCCGNWLTWNCSV